MALRHPLRVRYGEAFVMAESVTVNAHWALIHGPEPISLGTNLTVFNERTGQTSKAWVVFTREAERPGYHAIGFEFLPPAREFWGTACRP